MLRLPELRPFSINEEIRKICQPPKVNAVLRYLSKASVPSGKVILGNNDPTWDSYLGCTSLDSKVAAYGPVGSGVFYLAVGGQVIDKQLYAFCRASVAGGAGFRAQIYKIPATGLLYATLEACSDSRSLTTTLTWQTFVFPSDVTLSAGDYALSISGGTGGYYAQIGGLAGQTGYYVSPNGNDQCSDPYGAYGSPYIDYIGLIYTEIIF